MPNVTSNKEVIIRFRADIAKLNSDLKEARQMLNTNFSTKGANDLAKAEQNVFDAKQKLNQAMKQGMGLPSDFASKFTDVNAELATFSGQSGKSVDGMKMMNGAITTTTRKLEKMGSFLNPNVFQGWAMSLMFAGMALQRVYNTITKFGTKAFQEISHSVEGTVTNTDLLEGSMKYLGYTVGSAMDGIVANIIPLIDTIADWVDSNPKLVAWGTSLLGIVGTIAMVGGMFTLAWTNGLQPFINGIKNTNWANLGNSIRTGIGVIAIAASLKMGTDAIADFKNGKVFEGLLNALGATATLTGGVMLLKGKGKGGALVVAGFALNYAAENQDTFIADIIKVLGFVSNLIETSFESLGEGAGKAFTAMGKGFEVMYYKMRKLLAVGDDKNEWADKIAETQKEIDKLKDWNWGESFSRIWDRNKVNIDEMANDMQNKYNEAITGIKYDNISQAIAVSIEKGYTIANKDLLIKGASDNLVQQSTLQALIDLDNQKQNTMNDETRAFAELLLSNFNKTGLNAGNTVNINNVEVKADNLEAIMSEILRRYGGVTA